MIMVILNFVFSGFFVWLGCFLMLALLVQGANTCLTILFSSIQLGSNKMADIAEDRAWRKEQQRITDEIMAEKVKKM